MLLDVDGTLVDTAGILIRSLRYTLEKHLGGAYPDEELRDLLGRPLRSQMEHYSPVLAGTMASDFLHFYEVHQEEERPFADALALLPWMRSRGLRVCLVTSKSSPEMVITRSRFRGLHDVDAMVTSDETTRVKPFPDPALLALKRLNLAPGEAIMVGDSPYDMECSRSAGILAGAALWGPFPRQRLEPSRPDLWFTAPADLKSYLDHRLNEQCLNH